MTESFTDEELTKDSIDLQNIDFDQKIKSNGEDSIISVLTLHLYSESLMWQLFIYGHKFEKLTLETKKILFSKKGNKLGFLDLCVHHLAEGRLDLKQYLGLCDLNKFRNKIAHEFIKTEDSDHQFKATLKKSINFGLDICKYLQEELSKRLLELSRKPPKADNKSKKIMVDRKTGKIVSIEDINDEDLNDLFSYKDLT